MELLELSEEKMHDENKKLFKKIIKNYNYDLVIFIARGSYMIGLDLAKFNDVPLLEIFATRKGGKIKKVLRPLLKIIPKNIKKILRKNEFNSNYHEKNSDRNITFNGKIWNEYRDKKNILLIDDSVDTGYSIKKAKDAIESFFTNSNVKIAAINYFEKSKKIVNVDYFLYSEKMLLGPWSNDSKENKKYLMEYKKWHEEQEV